MATKKAARKKSASTRKTASRKKAASKKTAKKKTMSSGMKKTLGTVLVGAALGATAVAVRAMRKGKRTVAATAAAGKKRAPSTR